MSEKIDALAEQLRASVQAFVQRSLDGDRTVRNLEHGAIVDRLKASEAYAAALQGELNRIGANIDGMRKEIKDEIWASVRQFFKDSRGDFIGPAGPQGEKGLDGAPGPIGEKGMDGAPGPVGEKGLDGAPGPVGDKGLDGAPGPAGEKGMDGAPGEKGADGADGAQGPAGAPGESGEIGPVGPRGEKGEAGVQGERGEQGLAGPSGPVGAQGLAGERGTDGAPGEKGADGLQGSAGPQGERGEKGLDGAPGPIGERGLPGTKGLDGKNGRDGRDGVDGARGADGTNGLDGKSAADLDPLHGINDAISYQRGTWAVHRNGLFYAYRTTDPVENSDYEAAGWRTALNGFHDIVHELAPDQRTMMVSVECSNGRVIAKEFTVPTMIYRGVYRAGEVYEKGDVVTWAGSTWHAGAKTSEKPGAGSTAWTMSTKGKS